MIKKRRGFTLLELIVILAILGVMMGVAIPSLAYIKNTNFKNLTNTTHKIFVNAVDYWIKDNINPSQRPANFSALNSQGKTVLDYISNNDVYLMTNISKNPSGTGYNFNTPFEEGNRQIRVTFNNGILETSYMVYENGNFSASKPDAILKYTIYPLDDTGNIQNYVRMVSRGFVIEGAYKEADK